MKQHEKHEFPKDPGLKSLARRILIVFWKNNKHKVESSSFKSSTNTPTEHLLHWPPSAGKLHKPNVPSCEKLSGGGGVKEHLT